MAITLVPEQTTGAPGYTIVADDYNKQGALIAANEVPDLAFLTDWELTAAEPLLKKGVYIYHAGNTYIVDTADEAISGTPSAGVNYIEITLSGSTLTAAWVTSTTGYTYNPAYGGIYNGSFDQLLPDICYLSGTDYIRGRCFGMDYNFIHLADGNFIMASGIDTLGANIVTGGGNVDTESGDLSTSGGAINTNGGDIDLNGGSITSSLGTVYTGGDDINTSTGSITTTQLTLTSNLLPETTPEQGTQTLGVGGVWTPSRGVYLIETPPTSNFYVYISGLGGTPGTFFGGGVIFADGSTVRIINSGSSDTLNYTKF